MSFRKLLNEYPGLTTAISIGLLLIALGVIGFQVWARSQPPRGAPPHKSPHGEPLDSQVGIDVRACGASIIAG